MSRRGPAARSERTPPRGRDRAARLAAWGLLGSGVVTAATVAHLGGGWPPLLPLVVLGAVLAVASNRLTLFPSEWAATAEPAVLLAAAVGFSAVVSGAASASGGALLGPMVLALACGPADRVHWQQRAYWRMAYNSGNRALATAAATLVFGFAAGRSAPVVGLGLVVSATVFAAVDLVVFLGFERVRGTGSDLGARAREALSIDRLTVPLGVLGGLAGLLVAVAGWVACAAALLPLVFLPELALVRLGRLGLRARDRARGREMGRAARRATAVVAAAAVPVGVALWLAGAPVPATLVALVALGIVGGVEFRTHASVPVAPMVAVLVVAAAVVADGTTVTAAVSVAATATATAGLLARRVPWWAPLPASAAAAVTGLVVDARPGRAAALGAALGFQVLVFARPAGIVWTFPAVCLGVALAECWAATGWPGGVVFAAGFAAVGTLAASWGALPWRSGVLARRRGAVGGSSPRLSPAALALGAVVSSVVAVTWASARDEWVLAATALGCAVPAIVAVGVRQWRFRPRSRRRDAVLVGSGAATVLLGFPALAAGGAAWAPAVLGAALAACLLVGRPLARLVTAAPRARRSVPT